MPVSIRLLFHYADEEADEELEEEILDDLFCVACNKSFKSDRA